jgi:GAF domain-containing protein
MSANELASKLGIAIDNARRYLETGLSSDNIEACARFAVQSTLTLDEVVDMAAKMRERDQEKQVGMHVGTIRRSRRLTSLGDS